MRGRPNHLAVGSLAAMALMAAASETPEARRARGYARETWRIRLCFERMLTGIVKAHSCGFPNISRQQRRQLQRKGVL
jgi:hypothetical protein